MNFAFEVKQVDGGSRVEEGGEIPGEVFYGRWRNEALSRVRFSALHLSSTECRLQKGAP